jgi:SAM-dependent methyltransferase
MRRHDWTGFLALGAVILSAVALLRGSAIAAGIWAVAFLLLAVLTRYWSLKYRGPMPHLLRWTLLVPRGNHSPDHLRRILEPRSGERFLEIGPGVGLHSLPVATALAPGGTLDVFDIQQPMLDDVLRKARNAGIDNIIARQGDAQKLPYAEQTFDGGYLIGVLGEIPDGDATLREMRRVLKADGRLVVGEVILDPDFVSFSSLQARMQAAGFTFDRRIGGSMSYLARFRCA